MCKTQMIGHPRWAQGHVTSGGDAQGRRAHSRACVTLGLACARHVTGSVVIGVRWQASKSENKTNGVLGRQFRNDRGKKRNIHAIHSNCTHCPYIVEDGHWSDFIHITGELWGVYCEGLGENWPRYNDTTLYISCTCHCHVVCSIALS